MATKTARAMNRSLWVTAYHEAGHGTVAFVLGLRIGRGGISIVPSEDASGRAHILLQLRERPDIAIGPRTHVRIEWSAVVDLGWRSSPAKLAPRSRYAAHSDLDNAASLIGCISGCHKILNARLRAASLQARNVVNDNWEEISAVASALMEHKTLTPKQVKEVIGQS
jgi:hypothetical protein